VVLAAVDATSAALGCVVVGGAGLGLVAKVASFVAHAVTRLAHLE
jgi:hypothetical protein